MDKTTINKFSNFSVFKTGDNTSFLIPTLLFIGIAWFVILGDVCHMEAAESTEDMVKAIKEQEYSDFLYAAEKKFFDQNLDCRLLFWFVCSALAAPQSIGAGWFILAVPPILRFFADSPAHDLPGVLSKARKELSVENASPCDSIPLNFDEVVEVALLATPPEVNPVHCFWNFLIFVIYFAALFIMVVNFFPFTVAISRRLGDIEKDADGKEIIDTDGFRLSDFLVGDEVETFFDFIVSQFLVPAFLGGTFSVISLTAVGAILRLLGKLNYLNSFGPLKFLSIVFSAVFFITMFIIKFF